MSEEDEKIQPNSEETEENKIKENNSQNKESKESKISNKEDSISNKMVDLYAEHKKDVQNNQRPSSKYCRDRESGKRENESPEKIDEKNLIQKLNEHFKQRQITKKDFSDNQNVFLPIAEFRELFKNIHLNLSQEEIDFLFSNKNPNKDDGYIYFTTFLENYDFEFYPGESTLINQSNNDQNKIESSSNSNYTSLLLNKQPDKNSLALNNEFNSFKNDILNIVEQAKKPNPSKKKLAPIAVQSKKRPPSSNVKKEKPHFDDVEPNIENSKGRNNSKRKTTKGNSKTKKPKINYLKQTLQRQMLEEDMIKLTIEKRDKEFQRDCVKKMVLANEYAEKLNKPKSYSAYNEEGKNTIICRVFDKEAKDYKDINLKQFLIEFRKLEKLINQEKERETYKDQNEVKETVHSHKEEDFFKMDREGKHKIIKKILKESIQLKLQLKKQLKALRDKKLIDIDTLNKNLKLTNLDDDTVL